MPDEYTAIIYPPPPWLVVHPNHFRDVVANAVVRQMSREHNFLEELVVTAMMLQDFGKLDRLVTIHQPISLIDNVMRHGCSYSVASDISDLVGYSES